MSTHKLEEPVQLMFCVFHERDRQEYPIRIPRSATIQDLEDAIQAEYRDFTRVDLFNIKTFKVNYRDIHLHDVQIPAGENSLRRGYRVSTYWPDNAEISPDTVNILVHAQAYTGDALSSHRQDSSSDDDIVLSFEEMSLYQKKVREAVRKGLSSSIAAQPARFASQQAQADTPIFNGRPFQNTGPPIEIYHSVFRNFAQSMQDPIPPTAEDFKRVEQLLSESQALYSSKNDRKSAMKATLSKLLVGSITTEKIAKREADGVIKCQTGIEGLLGYPIILEVEQEIGTAQCDPSIQGAESYTHYWSQNEMAPLRDVSCCPSFIIAIAGPWMCILGAVYLDRVIAQPLTEFMWLARHPQQESRQARLTQILCALREGLKDARSYYESLQPQVGPNHLRLAPDLRQFSGQDGQAVIFTYTKSLVGQRPVFEARTDSGAIIVVKFVERYNAEAHRMLADKGFAPKLLFDSGNTIGGGVRMIVMEYVSGTDLHQFLSAN